MPAREALDDSEGHPLPGSWAKETLDDAATAGLLRRRRSRAGGSHVRCRVDGRDVLVLSSNDYLGLSIHREVREAAARAAIDRGVGASGSAHLSGCHEAAEKLEHNVSAFEGTVTATLAPTGYAANLAAIQALGGRDAVILSDGGNHASVIDGCRMSGCEVQVYRHLDLDDLERRLRRASGRPVIVSDTVFSMEGTCADVAQLNSLAEHHGAWLLLDEAHATGVLGPGGRGGAAAAGIPPSADHVVRVVTFSKALGAGGGAICGSRAVAQLLLQRGRALMFSTALPHPTVAAATAALDVLQRTPQLVDRLRMNARSLRQALHGVGSSRHSAPPLRMNAQSGRHGVPWAVLPGAADMPIIAVVLGTPARALTAEQRLWESGFLVQAVRPPAVPEGTSRLRMVASILHTASDLRDAAKAVGEAIAA
ncbi:MAG: aminotransferase class I/II-fold pyridoxal phosphate-dependent enzyme [Candidatus Dormibacteria bacterium]